MAAPGAAEREAGSGGIATPRIARAAAVSRSAGCKSGSDRAAVEPDRTRVRDGRGKPGRHCRFRRDCDRRWNRGARRTVYRAAPMAQESGIGPCRSRGAQGAARGIEPDRHRRPGRERIL